MAKPKAENLFHFTRSVESLFGILQNGFYPRFCLEDHSWFGMSAIAAAYPMVCFCDIPISRIKDHTDFYGSYGVGMSKEWALKNGLEPVIYSSGSGPLVEVSHYLYQSSIKSKREGFDTGKFGLFVKIARFIKPISGKMLVGEDYLHKEFYQESEWRYAPSDEVLFPEAFDSDRNEKDKEQEANVLQISPQDIKYIFVPMDEDIPKVVDFINTQLDHFPRADLKILTTRVISLNTIENDL